jgi:hypothetical protein
MAHFNAALMQQVVDVSQGQREADILITASRITSGLVRK